MGEYVSVIGYRRKWNYHDKLETRPLRRILNLYAPTTAKNRYGISTIEKGSIENLFAGPITDVTRLGDVQSAIRWLEPYEGFRDVAKYLDVDGRNYELTERSGFATLASVYTRFRSNLKKAARSLEKVPEGNDTIDYVRAEVSDLLDGLLALEAEHDMSLYATLELSAEVEISKSRRNFGYHLVDDIQFNASGGDAASGAVLSGLTDRFNQRDPSEWGYTPYLLRSFVLSKCRDGLARKKKKDGDRWRIQIRTHTEQTGILSYTTDIDVGLTMGSRTYDLNQRTQGSGGLPLVELLRGEEISRSGHVSAVAEKASTHLTVLRDIQSLAVLSNVAKELTARGANYPEITDDGRFEMMSMRVPLLVLDGEKCTPNNVDLTNYSLAVVTGANFNGKTTYLLGIAQNTILAQMGLPIFAEKAAITPRTQMRSRFATNEGSLSSGESQFSSEAADLYSVLEHLAPRSLILLDEMGTGTDPVEAQEILGRVFMGSSTYAGLVSVQGPKIFASTHYHDLAAEIAHNELVRALRFEVGTPFSVSDGLATTSNAARIASQKGLDDPGLEKIQSLWMERGIVP